MLCELCESDFTECGNRLCCSCREKHGDDNAKIDQLVSHAAYVRPVLQRNRLINNVLGLTKRVA